MTVRQKMTLLAISGLLLGFIPARGELFPGSRGWECLAHQQEARSEYPRVGIRDTERRSLVSKQVGREFEVDVFLPRD
jgi:hypothetical protein